jgi:hypothetical protein
VDIEVPSMMVGGRDSSRACRRRLTVVLSRYADVVERVRVELSGSDGCAIEVEFSSGEALRVSQDGGAELGALRHLIDRVGRAVARRVALEHVRGDHKA